MMIMITTGWLFNTHRLHHALLKPRILLIRFELTNRESRFLISGTKVSQLKRYIFLITARALKRALKLLVQV